MNNTLASLGFRLWAAKNISRPFERKCRVNHVKTDLNRYFIVTLLGDCKAQREHLNRRQRKAERDGVGLYHIARPFGIEFAQRKW